MPTDSFGTRRESFQGFRCSPQPVTIHRLVGRRSVANVTVPRIEIPRSTRYSCVTSSGRITHIRKHDIPLFTGNKHGVACRSGHELLLRHAIERSGRSVQSLIAPPPLPPAVRIELAALLPDPAVIQFVGSNEQGLIWYNLNRVDLAWVIRQLVQSWPEHRFLIIALTRGEAQELCYALGGRANGVKLYLDSTLSDRNTRIAITLPSRMGSAPLDAADIIIFLNAMTTTHKGAEWVLHGVNKQRVYGFLPRDEAPSKYEWARLTAVFGFDSVMAPAHGITHCKVRVVRVSIDGGPRPPAQASTLDLKRQGIWAHPLRNRWIARLARRLSAGQHGHERSLVQAGLDDKPQRVLVVVEGLDHALALTSTLKNWPILAEADANTDGIDAHNKRQIVSPDAFLGGDTAHAICTMSALPHIKMENWDVLIRCDAGIGGLELDLNYILEMLPKSACSLVVVDFADRHHPELRRRSRSRLDAYIRAEWEIVGMDPADVALQRLGCTLARRAR